VEPVLVWIASLLVLTAGILAAGHALLHNRDSRAAFGWIALCFILPVAGPIIYLVFGINRVTHRAKRDYFIKVSRDSLPTITEPLDTDLRPMSMVGERLTNKGLSACTEVRVIENGEQLYPLMLEAIDGATTKVLLSTYIFDNNATGHRFVDALHRAKNRGVEVKIIVDGLGEFMSLPRIGKRLRRAGIALQRFNPVTLFPPALNINMRSHRKLLIVDGLYAFTGGQNIGDRHLADRVDNPHRVLDLHFRLRGKIVDELEWAFWKDWHYCLRTHEVPSFQGSNENLEQAPVWSRLVLDGPNKDLDKLNNLILGVVSSAKSRVCIMTPYFLPTFDLIGALIAAHLRGVRVMILLSGKNNILLAHWASQNILLQILEHKIEIYYQPPPFIHSKLLLVDDEYSLIGSANIDPRSLRLNYEMGVELFSKDINAELYAYFEKKMLQARRVYREEIARRPLLTHIRDSLAWLFSPYL
jgi:cardiolipin synthase A/B